jgi:hypothetical protein
MRGLCNSWNFIGLAAGLGALLTVSPVIATETIEGVWARDDGAIHTRFTLNCAGRWATVEGIKDELANQGA